MRLSAIPLIVVSIILMGSKCSSKIHQEELYNSIESVVPLHYEFLEVDSALVNEDSCYDYLIALKKTDEQEGDSRPLLLLMSQGKSFDYQIEFRNDGALYSHLNGPYGGFENFAGIEFDADSIIIQYYAGMSTRWHEVHKFIFDKELNTYIFTTFYSGVDNIYDDEPSEEYEMNFENQQIALDTISIEFYEW